MTGYGRLNLLGMLGMPLFAAIASLIVFGFRADTQVYVFGTNLLPMLIGGVISALLIRSATKSSSDNKYLVAIAPSLLPAAAGTLWYLVSIVRAGADDAGREFFAGPIYLLGGAIVVGIMATIVYLVMPSASKS